MIKFGVIGYGYWGPNIVRNLRGLEGCQLVGICDQSPAARKRIQAAHPGVPVYSDAQELICLAGRGCHRGDHPGMDTLRTGQGGARKRQARFCREAVHQQRGAGGRTDQSGRAKKPADHGGPHVSFYRSGSQDPATADRRSARQAVLLRFDASEPGAVSTRLQRDLGSGAARSVDHELPVRKRMRKPS